MSVLETIIGKRKPNFDSYELVIDLLQKFMIESKSQASVREVTPPQQAVMTMYAYGAMAFLAEAHEVPEQELILLLGFYLQRQGLSDKQSVMEAKNIVEQTKDPNMQGGMESGYNSSMYWYKGEDVNATKALARLLKTTR